MSAVGWRPATMPAQRSRWILPAVWRTRLELRRLGREPVALLTTLGLPVLVQLAAALPRVGPALTAVAGGTGRLTIGLVTIGIMLCSFANIAVGTSDEVMDGTLDRLRGTQLPLSAYLAGKAMLALLTSLALAATLLVLGMVLTGLTLPDRPAAWGWLALFLVLGTVAGTGLGVAAAAEPRTWMTVPAVYLVVAVLALASGSVVDPQRMPLWVSDFGLPFPVRWLGQGLRAELLPGQVTSFDLGTAGGRWPVVGVLAAWAVVGLVQGLRGIRRMRDDAR